MAYLLFGEVLVLFPCHGPMLVDRLEGALCPCWWVLLPAEMRLAVGCHKCSAPVDPRGEGPYGLHSGDEATECGTADCTC